jgi:tRNA A-37 threonylcarbamoyl transferase component Bud32
MQLDKTIEDFQSKKYAEALTFHQISMFKRMATWKEPAIAASLDKVFNLWKEKAEPYATSDYTVMKEGSRSMVAKWQSHEGLWIIKDYKTPGLRRRARFALSQSRCLQSWNMSRLCHTMGIAAAKIILVAEERLAGLPGRSLAIMEYVQGTPLNQLVANQSLSLTDLRQLASRLAEQVNQLSSSMITHGDFKASNIIVDSNLKPHLIDLDGAILHRSKRNFWKAYRRDGARFRANWSNEDLVCVFAEVFPHLHEKV